MGPRWRYLINEVGIGLRRNLLMTIATVVTVTVSLALLGIGLLVQRQVRLAQRVLYADVQVSVFLRDDISHDQRKSLEAELRANPVVQNVIHVSQQDAYREGQKLWADQPEMLARLTPNLVPASFRVKLIDPEEYPVVTSQFAEYPGVEEIVDQRATLEKFFRFMDALRDGALAVALLQLVGATALISNTIRVTAFARREQTGIMKLVGATNWYIRLPFVIEGVIAGVIGALAAGALLLLGQATLLPALENAVRFIPFIGFADVLETIPTLVLISAVIASLASVLSLRRFLAV
ncbi:MAG: permease-like cell division protein FtsX [Egibacteraceae bacterium]